jgi:hypothetical protein
VEIWEKYRRNKGKRRREREIGRIDREVINWEEGRERGG